MPSDNGAIYATCVAKNDSKHPFEGSYFYPDEEDAEIEILDDGYAERLVAKELEKMAEEVVSKVARDYYIQGDIGGLGEQFRNMPVEEISKWENYVIYRSNIEDIDLRTLGTLWIYIDATTMNEKTDEEEYQMYENLFREKIGGEAMLFIYYLDADRFKEARKSLEESAPRHEGSDLDDAIENQPYFGTIMRNGSGVFDDSLEVFKEAKQGKEQEIFK